MRAIDNTLFTDNSKKTYAAFDVETPNRANDRMSAIGVTFIRDGKIIGDYYSLVNPETHFDYFNTKLTGISKDSVRDAPVFPEIWRDIAPAMNKCVLVAHNAVFDMGVLKRCLQGYNIDIPQRADYLCTVQIGRRLLPNMSHKLNIMCDYFGIGLDHHNAGSDSRACAEILLRYIQSGANVDSYIRSYDFSR